MKRYHGLFTISLAAVAVCLTPLAAQAHDQVVGTTPSTGQTVAAGVIDISVTFNEDIMQSPDHAGESVALLGPDSNSGYTLSNGCIDVNGATMAVKFDVDQPGAYRVLWRSVSNDGHPNEGEFAFNVTNDNGYKGKGFTSAVGPKCDNLGIIDGVATGNGGDAGTSEPDATPVAISAEVPKDWARDTEAGHHDRDNSDAALWVGYGFAGLGAALLLAFGGLVAASRRR